MISYRTNLRWLFKGNKETKFLIQSVASFPLGEIHNFERIASPSPGSKERTLGTRVFSPICIFFYFFYSRYQYTITEVANMKPHYSFLINRTQIFLIYLQISAFFISLICRFVRYETPLFSVYYLRLTPTKNVEIFRLPFCSTKNLNNGRVNLQSFGKHPKYSTQEEIMEQYGNGGAKVLKLWKVKKHKLYNTCKYDNPTKD